MPELCEVEVIRQELKKHFFRAKILQVEFIDPKLRYPVSPNYEKDICGGQILDIKRHGKYLLWQISGAKAKEVLFHLGMTGRLVWKENVKWQNHLRLIYRLSVGDIYFYDKRRFGYTFCGENLLEKQKLGEDALKIRFKDFQKICVAHIPIKALLMDQKKIAGIGNIYASEILFKAKIHPTKKANTLSLEEMQNLFFAIKYVLKKGIRNKGTTISDFYYGSFQKGHYQNHFAVYDRENKPCVLCQTPIKLFRYQNRCTYFCPNCQSNF